ncbi:MAG: DNA cytosine methyltransferase [Betaproteobacteria bacterium]|nr:DNA cytosine methyltransferase [Betaproteobacteria bacterium]
MNYYNDNDPYAAAWLRNLIAAGLLAQGDVIERGIEDVRPEELAGYRQCHWFAGLGGWPYALRLAGWPDVRPVWTGSCPCQPFSVAGNRRGTDDSRHLWPVWFQLISECRPPVIFGEQVDAAVAHGWLDIVSNDLEGIGYAIGSVVLPAACVGAPHIRHRLWFVADAAGTRYQPREATTAQERQPGQGGIGELPHGSGRHPIPDSCGLDHPHLTRLEGLAWHVDQAPERQGAARPATEAGPPCELGNTDSIRCEEGHTAIRAEGLEHPIERDGRDDRPGSTREMDSQWGNADWLRCRDGRWRPVESGSLPLVDGLPDRVGRIRAYGNALVPQLAAQFIRAFLNTRVAP